jgi:predicted lysophospholipase L1 biosynthesis ABC-type transport system permease subunit
MRDLDVDVGDTLDASGKHGVVTLRVVGQALFPPLGGELLLADSAWFTPEGLERVSPAAVDFVQYVVGQADAEAAMRHGFDVEQPRGTDLDQLADIDTLPLALAAFVGTVGAIALAHVLVASVRRRRGDLAVLRALGVTQRDSRSIVRWQALTAVVLGAVLGVPLGVIAGAAAWRFEANRLGIASDIAFPITGLAVALTATLVVALACTAVPAHRAARLRPAAILRAE